MQPNYIYLIYEREFINSNKNIYKIGKTKQLNSKRFNQYPKGSILLFQLICQDCDKMENILVDIFKNKYKQRKDIGTEYFEGDGNDMINTIYLNILNDNKFICLNMQMIDIINCNDKGDNVIENKTNISDDELKSQGNVITENKTNFSDVEEDLYIEMVEINTYEEYMDLSKIYKIIITNKKTHEGYLKYKNSVWVKLHNKKLSIEIDDVEGLEGYINNENNSSYNCVKIIKPEIKIMTHDNMRKIYATYKNIDTQCIISNNDFINLPISSRFKYELINNCEYKIIDVKYNYKKIITDIIQKCYVENPTYYELKYNEYAVRINEKMRLYNSINGDICDLDEYNKNDIIYNQSNNTNHIITKSLDEPINTSIVSIILENLIKNPETIKEYNVLCYNILVEQSNNTTIFYDYYDDLPLLCEWLRDAYRRLTNNIILYSKDYYNDIKKYNDMIKTKIPRIVIIDTKHLVKEKSTEEMIENFKNKGIKNIIVIQKDNKKTIYKNLNNFIKYIHESANIITPHLDCSFLKKYNNEEDVLKNIIYPDTIFYKPDLLCMNFIKWCCINYDMPNTNL
jgi:hypothetical protein